MKFSRWPSSNICPMSLCMDYVYIVNCIQVQIDSIQIYLGRKLVAFNLRLCKRERKWEKCLCFCSFCRCKETNECLLCYWEICCLWRFWILDKNCFDSRYVLSTLYQLFCSFAECNFWKFLLSYRLTFPGLAVLFTD